MNNWGACHVSITFVNDVWVADVNLPYFHLIKVANMIFWARERLFEVRPMADMEDQ
jgi:hypothetical protein